MYVHNGRCIFLEKGRCTCTVDSIFFWKKVYHIYQVLHEIHVSLNSQNGNHFFFVTYPITSHSTHDPQHMHPTHSCFTALLDYKPLQGRIHLCSELHSWLTAQALRTKKTLNKYLLKEGNNKGSRTERETSKTIRFIPESSDKVMPNYLQQMTLQVPDIKSLQKNLSLYLSLSHYSLQTQFDLIYLLAVSLI